MLLQVADSNYLVNESFVGDVYTINSKENKFGCFVVTPMNAVKYSVGTIRYTYVLYYIDRLTKKEDNIDFVQTDGVNVLKGLINFISEHGIEPEEGYEFTLFKQKFSDWCAGAYVNVSFLVPDNDCDVNDFNIYGADLRPLYVDINGTYTPDGFDGYSQVIVDIEGGDVTPEWVDNEIDIKLEGYATQSWCTSKFPDKRELNDYATRSWVLSKNYASESWVSSKIIDVGLGLQGWVRNQNFATESWVYGKKYATQSWVQSQGYLTSVVLSGYATESWVQSQGYLTEVPDNYATKKYVADAMGSCEAAVQSWVSDQEFLTSVSLSGYATQSWVNNQHFATQSWVSTAISGLAAMSWVSDQHFLTSASLSGYATESWVSSNYVPQSSIWTGTASQWNQLTSAQKAAYTIALITE